MSTPQLQKYYRYQVSDRDGVYIGDYHDVIDDFEFTEEVNTPGGELVIYLGRPIDRNILEYGYWLLEDGSRLVSEASESLVLQGNNRLSVGEGTDVALNNRVTVDEYYSQSGDMQLEDGFAWLLEDGSKLKWQWGAPEGRRIFTGFISSIAPDYDEDREAVAVTCLPLAADMSTYLYTPGRVIGASYGTASQAIDFGSGVVGEKLTLIQSFTMTSTGKLDSIRVTYSRSSATETRGVTLRCQLFTTGDPNNSGRSLLATVDATFYGSTSPVEVIFQFAGNIELVNGQMYHFEIGPHGYLRLSTTDAYPARLYGGSDTFPSYVGYYTSAGTSGAVALNKNLYHSIDLKDASTVVTATNRDSGLLLRSALFSAITAGARLNFTSLTVPNTGILISQSFKANTILEVFDFVMKSLPSDFYWFQDQATGMIRLKKESSTADHVLSKGVHLQKIKPLYSLEEVANTIYILGGEAVSGDPATRLFKLYVDQESINLYGRRVLRVQDSRITTAASADIIGKYLLDDRKSPGYTATVTVLDWTYDIDTIKVGDTIGLTGFGNYVDGLVLRVSKRARQRGKVVLTLGKLLPDGRKKLEVLKRTLEAELQNNAPSGTS